MSYKRAAGWIMMKASTGFINHYFRDNQTKALCGTDYTPHVATSPNPASVRICRICQKRWVKSQGINGLTVRAI